LTSKGNRAARGETLLQEYEEGNKNLARETIRNFAAKGVWHGCTKNRHPETEKEWWVGGDGRSFERGGLKLRSTFHIGRRAKVEKAKLQLR